MAHLARRQPVQAGHVHPVVIDEMQLAIVGDQQVPGLQVAMSQA